MTASRGRWVLPFLALMVWKMQQHLRPSNGCKAILPQPTLPDNDTVEVVSPPEDKVMDALLGLAALEIDGDVVATSSVALSSAGGVSTLSGSIIALGDTEPSLVDTMLTSLLKDMAGGWLFPCLEDIDPVIDAYNEV